MENEQLKKQIATGSKPQLFYKDGPKVDENAMVRANARLEYNVIMAAVPGSEVNMPYRQRGENQGFRGRGGRFGQGDQTQGHQDGQGFRAPADRGGRQHFNSGGGHNYQLPPGYVCQRCG